MRLGGGGGGGGGGGDKGEGGLGNHNCDQMFWVVNMQCEL